ncbi:hypothetical protein EDD22DRAFT_845936 [Suillus occidentalis]|nr:hypothetical protein EDD22DRAFT_845936 [Suillus occidentalis]
MHSWWMFPFERIIGGLQKTNPNHKIDEVFRMDTGILRTAAESIPYVSHNDANIIKTPISDILKQALEKADTYIPGNGHIMEYKRLQIAGLQYSTRKHSTSDSCIFLQNTSGEFGPGVIEHMFSVGQDHDRAYYVAIRCYLPTPAEYEDPFQEYSDFGAQIWSCVYTSQLDIVPVCTSRLCHAILMDWGASEVVLKPMNQICKQDSTSKMSIAISLLFPFPEALPLLFSVFVRMVCLSFEKIVGNSTELEMQPQGQ